MKFIGRQQELKELAELYQQQEWKRLLRPNIKNKEGGLIKMPL